jgi:hypothetical protein
MQPLAAYKFMRMGLGKQEKNKKSGHWQQGKFYIELRLQFRKKTKSLRCTNELLLCVNLYSYI